MLPMLLIMSIGIGFLLTLQSEHKAEALSFKTFGINMNNPTYWVQYLLSNATVTSMELDQSDKTLRLNFTAWDDGYLTIRVPRELIDSLNQNGNDIPFLVTLHKGSNENETAILHNSEATDTYRRFDISFTNDTNLVEIKGTRVVPEFSSIGIMAIFFVVLSVTSFLWGRKFANPLGHI